MEPAKVAIFIVAFLLLLLLGRMLSSRAEVHASQLPRPDPGPAPPGSYRPESQPSPPGGLQGSLRAFKAGLTGAEIGFSFPVPPVIKDQNGHYNRPYYLNYYFKKIDLLAGPADPRSFYDSLVLMLEDPETQMQWNVEYFVVTPGGLGQAMREGDYESIYLDLPMVVVREWSLETILRTVLEEQMKAYYSHHDEANPPAIE